MQQTQQEVRKIVSRIGYGLRAPACVLRGREPGKYKTALRTSCRAETLQDASVVSAETPVVFSVIPGNSLRDGVGLVKLTAGCRGAQPTKRGKTDAGYSPVKRVVRNPADPRAAWSGNVNDVRIEVGCRNMIVVIVHAKNVCDAAFPVGPPRAGVKPLRSRSAREQGEGIHDVVRTARPVQSKIDIILRTPASAASTASSAEQTESGAAACAEVVDQPEVHRIGIALRGRHVLKVLAGSCLRNVRQRDVLQERRRCRTDQGRIELILHAVELILLPGPRIENLNGLAVVVLRRGKIAAALILRGHRRECIVRRAPAQSIPSGEKEPFVAPVKYLGDIQRPADVDAETRLVVIRFRRFNSRQRIRSSIQSRVIVGEIQHAVRLIDVEAFWHPAQDDHPAAGSAEAAAPAAPETTAAFPLRAIAKLLNPLLQILFAPSAKVLRPPLCSANAHRLRRSLRSRSVHGKA